MPIKGSKKREYQRDYMRLKRSNKVQTTSEGITSNQVKGITLLERPNGADYDPDELMTDGTKRYMGPFTDGQVLDNTTVGLDLTPSNHVAMRAWATATLFTPNKYAQVASAVK